MRPRKLLLATLAVALLATVTSQAFASLAEMSRKGVLNYAAAAGEANRITIKYSKKVFTITDGAATIKVGGRCRRRSRKPVLCDPRPPRGGEYSPALRVQLGDLDDRLTQKPARRNGFTTVHAGSGNDVVKAGTGYVYGYFYGESGNDVIVAGAAEDSLDGGLGSDDLSAGAGNDEIYGDSGYRRGAADPDRLDGGPGNDRMNGGTGDDTLLGGAGNDTLGTNGGGDPPELGVEEGADTFDGGPGDDGISGLDGEYRPPSGGAGYGLALTDRISCGPGDDHVLADQNDVVAADCERVERRQVEPPPPPPQFP